MAYGVSNGHVTDDVTWPRKVKLVTPMRLERKYRKQLDMLFSNNRSPNYSIVCCEAVRSAILATAWLLVCYKCDSRDCTIWSWTLHHCANNLHHRPSILGTERKRVKLPWHCEQLA